MSRPETCYLSQAVRSSRAAMNSDEEQADGGGLEGIVSRMLASNEVWDRLMLDVPLGEDDIERQTFDILVRNPRFTSLLGYCSYDGSVLLVMLSRALPFMPRLTTLGLGGNRMTETEARNVFQLFRKSHTLEFSPFIMENSDDIEVMALAQYVVREPSPIKYLSIAHNEGKGMSDRAFHVLCDAIRHSKSLRYFLLDGSEVISDISDVKSSEAFASAAIASTSLGGFSIEANPSSTLVLDQVCHFMSQTADIQNCNVSFARISNSDNAVRIVRNVWWNQYLVADDNSFPLGLWPHLLYKADNEDQLDGHSHLDLLFHLIREKNPVHLQNVRRRKIRKRKRFGISW